MHDDRKDLEFTSIKYIQINIRANQFLFMFYIFDLNMKNRANSLTNGNSYFQQLEFSQFFTFKNDCFMIENPLEIETEKKLTDLLTTSKRVFEIIFTIVVVSFSQFVRLSIFIGKNSCF